MGPTPAAVQPAPAGRASQDTPNLRRLPLRHSLLLSFVRIWMGTWRLRWPAGAALPGRGVLVLWHEHLPACIPAFAKRRIHVLVSRSADGSLAAEACRRLGYRVHRGSDTAGALAGMKALARGLRDGGGLAGMALDGPRGPRRAAKPGTLWLSAAADVAVLPIAVKASWALRLKTWDRTLLPLPFARVEILVGDPCRPSDAEALVAAMDANQARLDQSGGDGERYQSEN